MHDKRSILNYPPAPLTASARHVGVMVTVAILMLFAMVAAFGTAPNTVIYTGQLSNIVEQLGAPPTFQIYSEHIENAREIRIQRGDTVSSMLSRMDIRDDLAANFLRSSKEAEAIFRQLAPGKTITAKVTANGELQSLTFPLNGGNDTAMQIQRQDQGFDARVRNLQFESQISLQSAVIRHSLFGATDDAGIPDSIAIQLADIFSGDIDFHKDLRKGDRFSVLYESTSHLGKSIRTERILAAEFINAGKAYHAFWFADNEGLVAGGYYTAEGRSVRKTFLRSPLEFSRITSGFTNARYHPVLKETRAHRGIDYGAPTGTRVKATGDGIVDVAGVQGGYGKVVMLRHPGDRMTVYGHLSGFALGIKKGSRVTQGDVIGYVGATGLATGPHLHYEFRMGGIHRNPMTATLPPTPPLPPSRMLAFRAHTNELMSQITVARNSQLVLLD